MKNIKSFFDKLPNWRYSVFFVLLALTALVLLGRFGWLMLGKSGTENAGETPGEPFPERGSIFDRNGRFLAIQVTLAEVGIKKSDSKDIETEIALLAPILEMPPAEIRQRLNSSRSDIVYLKRQVDESTVLAINNARRDAIKDNKKVSGIIIDPIPGRIYPEQALASQMIGYSTYRNVGSYGIEAAFDVELSGKENNGKGSHVVLTIDSNVQHILENIAQTTMTETGADAVMLTAMDPRTGEILGAASLPGYNLNEFNSATDKQRINRVAGWTYEPGSVFKVFSLASLLDSGAINANSTFVCNGSFERSTNREINCLGSHGRVGAREIIINSCNVGTAYASERIDDGTFDSLLRNFGFGEKTGAGAPAEEIGILRPVERWTNRSKATIAMGQEISVSALQMLQAAGAIANDGIMVPPRIVSRIISADGRETKLWNPAEKHRVLKPETARAMRSYMVDVTSNIGTGWRARVEDLSLAVKTGTAQVRDPATGRYSETDFIASCIAILPAESPSLILYLVIIRPQGEILGGRIAAPPIREAAEALVDYLGIPRGRNPQIERSPAITLPLDRLPAVNNIMPDFSGLSKRTLIPLLLQDNFHVEIYGDGWVVRQSPPPGTPLTGITELTLELE